MRGSRDLRSERRIRRYAGRGGALPPRVVAAGGDAQHAAQRGDRMRGLMDSHEVDSFGGIEPVCRANQAAPFFRISRSSRSVLFSRRNRRSSSRSSVVRPSERRPLSRAAGVPQIRIDYAVGSNFSANSSGLRPARAISTIRCLNSAGYALWDLDIVNSSSPERDQVSTEPRAVQT